LRRTSARARANRRNARLSTGPKTSAGKARSAQNALKHGLAIPISASTVSLERAAELTSAIAGENATTERLEAAREVAEAQANLERARIAHETVIARDIVSTVVDHENRGSLPREIGFPVSDASGGRSFGELLSELKRLSRYERRALSQRKKAMRRFENLEE
jgi:hypothetical protein